MPKTHIVLATPGRLPVHITAYDDEIVMEQYAQNKPQRIAISREQAFDLLHRLLYAVKGE